MARIPEGELERLKRDVSLERLVRAAGVELSRHGPNDLIGRCVFHSDKEPSLVITPSKNLFHCFGCNAGGSVLDWVMKVEGVSLRHAYELLRNGYSGSTIPPTGPVKSSTVLKLECPFVPEMSDAELINTVMSLYHRNIDKPEAQEYLIKRGLDRAELVREFSIGYSDRTLGLMLPDSNRKMGGEIRSRLERIGFIKESGHELFRGSIVFPVKDENGNVVEVYGRKVCDRLRPGTPKHLYLPGPHKGIWNLKALQATDEIILCESIIDAAAFWRWGYRNVTTSYGVNGFTDEMFEAFKRYGIKVVHIAYDRDETGEKAAESLSKKLIASGITCYRVQFPKGMDANEYALKVTPADKSLGLLIRSAAWLGGREQSAVSDQLSVFSVQQLDREAVAALSSKPSILNEITQPKEEGHFLLAADPTDETEEIKEAEQVQKLEPPPGPCVDVPVKIEGEDVVMWFGDRRYRIRNLEKNLSPGQIRVNILASRGNDFYGDTIDVCMGHHRATFSKTAAVEIRVEERVISKDLGSVWLKLEQMQTEHIARALEPKERAIVLTDEEEASALGFLRSPDLLENLVQHFKQCGIVGEENNVITGYLAAVSRKLEKPLAILIQSSSAAGKSSLMEAVLSFMPEEEQVKYSAMTGQSLFYMEGTDLKHKILAIAEEEGAQRASYALKLLQSEGELKIASTGKDPTTGRLTTHEYKVEGPTMIFSTTTAIEIDEELLNRCIVLSVDEDREQTRAIHKMQREMQTLKGLWAKEERKHLRRLHRNVQRLLKPLEVVNPYANDLTFLDDKTRTRRDHEKYLTLILSVTLLHQYQREIKTVTAYGITKQYIETTLEDIEVANTLASEILGRSLDELPPQTRRFLLLLDQMVKEECKRLKVDRSEYRFSRRDIREYTGWSYDQVRKHIDRLADMEYLLAHRGGRGQNFVYELLYDGKGSEGEPFLIGLIDVEQLRVEKSAGMIQSLGVYRASMGG